MNNNNRSSSGNRTSPTKPYSGLSVVQTGIATYAIFLPTQQQICLVAMPPNRQYIKDAESLAGICKILSARWSNP